MTNEKAMNISNCVLYYDKNETICQQHLQSYMTCLKGPGSTSNIYIPSPFQEHLLTAKDRLYMLSQYRFLIRQQCYLRLEPLVCLYSVHLCDNGNDIGPSEEQCKHVSHACDEELKYFRNSQIDGYLSNCASESPFNNKDCNITNTEYTSVSAHNCSVGFYLSENGHCTPECNIWSPYSRSTVLATDIVNIFAVVVCVISGVAVLVLSWLYHQK